MVSTSLVPATREAEAEQSLEPGRRRLQWAEITPLHSSLSNRAQDSISNRKKGSLICKRQNEDSNPGLSDFKSHPIFSKLPCLLPTLAIKPFQGSSQLLWNSETDQVPKSNIEHAMSLICGGTHGRLSHASESHPCGWARQTTKGPKFSFSVLLCCWP